MELIVKIGKTHVRGVRKKARFKSELIIINGKCIIGGKVNPGWVSGGSVVP
jgi:hypothetical protein